MKVHFSIYWSKTGLYNAGNRDLTINWNQGEGFPRKGEAINIPKFIGENYKINETFRYNNMELNVFDWIEDTKGWEVEKVKWGHDGESIFLNVLIGNRD
ncbi:hypothetical protein [Aquimarina aggregata]|uniref:hypothetical protein n=1 Tax=Aquimarina aggregata TaxID=1642818 RepID=UPI0024931C8B|nr:hypothetical protein [Aquimarina aggregata]